jgi:hypothetical protein
MWCFSTVTKEDGFEEEAGINHPPMQDVNFAYFEDKTWSASKSYW